MPVNYDSDDESGGGAPLHSPLTTPVAHNQSRHKGPKTASADDEEKALVRASTRFGSLNDPFAETPGVPRSVPASGPYPHRNAFPQPTPSRGHNNFNRFGNVQSANRYHPGPPTVGGSAHRPQHGPHNTGFTNGSPYPVEVR